MKKVFDTEFEGCGIGLQLDQHEEIWELKKLLRFAKIYNKRFLVKQTKTRRERVVFFNYILKNWDELHQNGKVRVVPSDSADWFVNRNDNIFSIAYGMAQTG